jgi:predicted transposase YbfD/YdcC
MAMDGKVIRGTIRAGRSRGVHLLAAYLPKEGVVLAQVQVRPDENEIPAAARLLRMMDLRGKIVTGDAIMAQRELSKQIVRAGGEYIWPIKENQPDTHEDIRVLFEPEARAKGFAPAKRSFGTKTTTGKGHGRLEKRTIKVSSALRGYLDWPHAEQVFRIERRVLRLVDGKESDEVAYGITSLTPQEAAPAELLALVRKHWAIENSLHYCRDDTLREDRCTLRTGSAPRAIAAINNLLLGLLRHKGVTNVPDARRLFAARPEEAWKLIISCP